MNRLFSTGFISFYAILGCVSLLGHAPQAHTCSPMPSGVHGSTPDSGSDLPSNSAVVFNVRNMTAQDFTATLDGASIDLEAVTTLNDNFNFTTNYYLALRPQIEPAVGQELVIEGCYQEMCSTYTFNITAADNDLPVLPGSWSFSMHDYEFFPGNGAACQGSSSLAYFLDFFGTTPTGTSEATNYYVVKAFLATDTDSSTPLLQRVIQPYGATATTSFRINDDQINSVDPSTGVCFQIQAIDAAENTSTDVSTQCLPCYSLTDIPPEDNGNEGPGGAPHNWMSQPSEPLWTDDHLHPGGTCSTEDPCDYIECSEGLQCNAPNQTVMSSYNACSEPPVDGGVDADPCDQITCPQNTHCEAGDDTALTVQEHCIVDDPVICDLECQDGYVCALQEVLCFTNPCPPVEICVLDNSDADGGAAWESPVSTDAGAEYENTSDAGPDAPEPQTDMDAGTTISDGEGSLDAGVTTSETDPTTDAGVASNPTEAPPSNGTEDETINCACKASEQHRSPTSLFLIGLIGLGLGLRRRLK